MFKEKIKSAKVYVGCGSDIKKGYIGCDIRKLNNIDIVCKAWQLSQYCKELNEVYSRHMLEHLTFKEVEATLIDWNKALKEGGIVHIIVPNLDFHIDQWNNAEWTEETYSKKWSDASWSIGGIYGWQRECNPLSEDYNNLYWDVHKSGFSKKNIYFFMKRANFINIKVSIVDKIHLVINAQKKER